MPARAGQIVIDITTGQAKALLELENLKGKLREIGPAAQGSIRNATQVTKAFETGVFDSNRAMTSLLVNTLKIGPALNTAFIGLGFVALGEQAFEAGRKVYDFFKGVQEAPAKVAAAFRELAQPIQLTNDALEVSNVRLQNEIDKLQGKHENTVALALAEAREAADKLSDSLDKDIGKMAELLKKDGIGTWESLLFGVSDQKLKDLISRYREIQSDPQTATSVKLYAAGNAQAEIARMRTATESEKAALAVRGSDDPARDHLIALLDKVNAQIARESANTTLQTQHGDLEGKHAAAVTEAEAAKKAAEAAHKAWTELNEAVQQNYAARAEGLERLGFAQEANDIREQAARTKANSENPNYRGTGNQIGNQADVIENTFDLKAASAYAAELKKLAELQMQADELDRRFREDVIHGARASAEEEARDTKEFEENSKRKAEALLKVLQATTRLRSEISSESAAHQIRMAGILGNPQDPIGTLKAQQDIERKQIQERYESEKRIADLQSDTRAAQDAALDRELAVKRLEDEMAEARARKAQEQFQSLLEPLTSGVASQLADLATGKKTDFGRMLQGVGHQLAEQGIKAALQQLITKIAPKHLAVKKPTGNPGDPVHVVVDNNGNPTDGTPVKGPSTASKVWGNIMHVLSGLGLASSSGGGGGGGGGGSASSTISYGGIVPGDSGGASDGQGGQSGGGDAEGMAAGGNVYAGTPYNTYDSTEEEVFVPKRDGRIIPSSKLGGGATYNIDARGADLGAHNRIARGLEASHAAQPGNAVRAQAERQKRTPQRSKH